MERLPSLDTCKSALRGGNKRGAKQRAAAPAAASGAGSSGAADEQARRDHAEITSRPRRDRAEIAPGWCRDSRAAVTQAGETLELGPKTRKRSRM